MRGNRIIIGDKSYSMEEYNDFVSGKKVEEKVEEKGEVEEKSNNKTKKKATKSK